MANITVILILVDKNLNLLLIEDAEKKYNFPTKKINKNLNLSDDENAKNVAIGLLASDCNLIISKEQFNTRFSEASLLTVNQEKIYTYVLKLDDTEEKNVRTLKNVKFIHINSLPRDTLSPLSASIAITITKYFDIIRTAINPPILTNFIYPIRIIPYYPSLRIPVQILTPINIPKKSINDTDNTELFIEKTKSPKSQPRKVTPKEKIPIIYKKKLSPTKPKKSTKMSETSSVLSKSSKKSKGSKKSRRRSRGGYYEKYIKYKIKYLESEKHILYLEEKINKFNNI